MKTDFFQSCGHCWLFQICWHIECSTFTASFFRIWNSSTGVQSCPLAFFIMMLPKAHLTSHSRISDTRWVITSSWLSGSLRSFLCSSSVYSCHLFWLSSEFRLAWLSFSPLPLASLLYSVLWTAFSDIHFVFFAFIFLDDDLDHCLLTMSWISIHSSSGTLSDLIPWIYLSFPLYNSKGFNSGHTWMV